MGTIFAVTYKEQIERNVWRLHAVYHNAKSADEAREAFKRPNIKVLSIVVADDKEKDLLIDGQVMRL